MKSQPRVVCVVISLIQILTACTILPSPVTPPMTVAATETAPAVDLVGPNFAGTSPAVVPSPALLPWYSKPSSILFICSPNALLQEQFLCMYDPGSETFVYLTQDPDVDFLALAWSSDAQSLATLVSYSGSSLEKILVFSPDGKSQEVLSTNDHIQNLSWSPDGKQLFFALSTAVEWKYARICYLSDLSTLHSDEDIDCIPIDGYNRFPDVSIDGYVYFSHAADFLSPSSVWRYRLHDGMVEELISSQDDSLWPRVSPSGKYLLYVVIPAGQDWRSAEIYQMDLSTRTSWPISPGLPGYQPAWMTNEAQVVFVSGIESEHQVVGEAGVIGYKNLFIINVDGTELRNLTRLPRFSAEQPVWVDRR